MFVEVGKEKFNQSKELESRGGVAHTACGVTKLPPDINDGGHASRCGTEEGGQTRKRHTRAQKREGKGPYPVPRRVASLADEPNAAPHRRRQPRRAGHVVLAHLCRQAIQQRREEQGYSRVPTYRPRHDVTGLALPVVVRAERQHDAWRATGLHGDALLEDADGSADLLKFHWHAQEGCQVYRRGLQSLRRRYQRQGNEKIVPVARRWDVRQ